MIFPDPKLAKPSPAPGEGRGRGLPIPYFSWKISINTKFEAVGCTHTFVVPGAPRVILTRCNGDDSPERGRDEVSWWGDHVHRTVGEGDTISVGNIKLTAHATPGHSPGCTSWTTVAREKKWNHTVVFFCSASVAAKINAKAMGLGDAM